VPDLIILDLVERRLARKLSRQEVATRIGVSAQRFGQWELGRCEPSLRLLREWGLALDVVWKPKVLRTPRGKSNG